MLCLIVVDKFEKKKKINKCSLLHLSKFNLISYVFYYILYFSKALCEN